MCEAGDTTSGRPVTGKERLREINDFRRQMLERDSVCNMMPEKSRQQGRRGIKHGNKDADNQGLLPENVSARVK